MTKRKMFLRMITASLLRRRSRMLIALLSIAVGATILSGLITIYIGVPRQMRAEMRSYGANMILLPSSEGALTRETLNYALGEIPRDEIVGAAPYRYVRLDMPSRQQSFTAAGTDFEEVRKTSPYFGVEGEYPVKRREILLGKEVADTIGAKVGTSLELSFTNNAASQVDVSAEQIAGASLTGSAKGFNEAVLTVNLVLDDDAKIESIDVDASSQTENIGALVGTDKDFLDQFTGKSLPLEFGEDIDGISGATMSSKAVVEAVNAAGNVNTAVPLTNSERFDVAGILSTGGEEEEYIYMSLDDMERLTGDTALDVAELSISADSDVLEKYGEAISDNKPGITSRLVKRVTRSEASVLGKLQALILLVTVVVLALTMISVSTTMMAVVSERRREIGLRKALGASDASIRTEFLGEGMFLGGFGGLIGGIMGFVFAEVVSMNVFGSSITFIPLLLPLTLIVSMAVAAASCQPPIKKAVAIDPAIVLKGE